MKRKAKAPALWLVMATDGRIWSLQSDHETRAEATSAMQDMRTVAAKYGYDAFKHVVVKYVPAPSKKRRGK